MQRPRPFTDRLVGAFDVRIIDNLDEALVGTKKGQTRVDLAGGEAHFGNVENRSHVEREAGIGIAGVVPLRKHTSQ